MRMLSHPETAWQLPQALYHLHGRKRNQRRCGMMYPFVGYQNNIDIEALLGPVSKGTIALAPYQRRSWYRAQALRTNTRVFVIINLHIEFKEWLSHSLFNQCWEVVFLFLCQSPHINACSSYSLFTEAEDLGGFGGNEWTRRKKNTISWHGS